MYPLNNLQILVDFRRCICVYTFAFVCWPTTLLCEWYPWRCSARIAYILCACISGRTVWRRLRVRGSWTFREDFYPYSNYINEIQYIVVLTKLFVSGICGIILVGSGLVVWQEYCSRLCNVQRLNPMHWYKRYRHI